MNRQKFIKIISLGIAGLLSLISFRFIKDFMFPSSTSIKNRKLMGTLNQITSKLESSSYSYYIDTKNKILFLLLNPNNSDSISIKNIKAFSLVCPHLGCTLTTNSNNEFLVCPCHGSRFEFLNKNPNKENRVGKLVVGPSNKNLKEYKLINIDNNIYLEV